MPASSIDAWLRLSAALVVSAALHGLLVYGVTLPAPSPNALAPALLVQLADSEALRSAPPSDAPPSARKRASAPLGAAQVASSASNAAAAPPRGDVSSALPAVAFPLIEDTTWYSAMQLDVYPRTLLPVHPDYPARALAERLRGEISLAVMIDAAGAVQEAQVIEASPQGYFEQSAISAVKAAHFAPAQKDGRNVRSQIVVRLVFALDSHE